MQAKMQEGHLKQLQEALSEKDKEMQEVRKLLSEKDKEVQEALSFTRLLLSTNQIPRSPALHRVDLLLPQSIG